MDENGVDLDGLFNALSHPIRRHLLLELRDTATADLPLTIPDDITHLNDPGTDQDMFKVNLHHVHLPVLDADDYIDWDDDSNHVHPGDKLDTIRPILNAYEEFTVNK